MLKPLATVHKNFIRYGDGRMSGWKKMNRRSWRMQQFPPYVLPPQ
jgi:hypothetical protein